MSNVTDINRPPAQIMAAELMQRALALLAGVPASELPAAPDRIVRLPEVQRLTGLGRSAIYDGMSGGEFPRQVALTPGHGNAVGWRESEILEWIRSRPTVEAAAH